MYGPLRKSETTAPAHPSLIKCLALTGPLLLVPVSILRHDLLEFIGQCGLGSQASVHAAGQVGNAVGTRQAKSGGEFARRDFAVAAAEPGNDSASDVGISALGQC